MFDNLSVKRELLISAVDMNVGKSVVFDNGWLTSGSRIAEAILASTAIPGIFNPNVIDD
jgi:predicted acylesterase/phospholipase RssA